MRPGSACRRAIFGGLLSGLVVLATIGSAVGSAGGEPSAEVRAGVGVFALDTGRVLWAAAPKRGPSYFDAVPGRGIVVGTLGACGADPEGLQVEGLVAFDADTGRKRWTVHSREYALRTTARTATSFESVVPVDAAGVVVTTGERGLTGYRAADGKATWTRTNSEYALGVTDSAVFTASSRGPGGTLRALDRRTGKVEWEHDGLDDPYDLVAADARHVVLVTGDILHQPYGSVILVVLDARSGREVSRFTPDRPQLFSFSQAMLSGDALVYVEGGAVVRRRLHDGSEEWRHDFHVFPGVLGLAVGRDRATVYAVYDDEHVRWTALDTTSGRARWTKVDRLLRTAGRGTAVFTDQDQSRGLHGVDARSGRTTWSSDVPARVAPPAFDASELQVNTAGGRVTASATCTDG